MNWQLLLFGLIKLNKVTVTKSCNQAWLSPLKSVGALPLPLCPSLPGVLPSWEDRGDLSVMIEERATFLQSAMLWSQTRKETETEAGLERLGSFW